MMRTVLADDEPSARSRLRRLLAPYPDVQIAGEARDGLEAVQKVEELHPDLLFLDIAMPGMAGFEVLQALSAGGKAVPLPLVIFATGFDQHALAAFEANALAYLLKPIEPQRLAQALQRARKLSAFPLEAREERERVAKAVARETSQKPWKQIVCRKRDRAVLVPPDQILWFQVEAGIVKAHTAADTYTVHHQLSELEANLPAELFFRARREALVNLSRIKEIRPYFKSGFVLLMADSAGSEVVVSERQAPALRQRIPGL